MSTISDTIEKIRKLLRLQRGGTRAEIAIGMSKAANLAKKFKIDFAALVDEEYATSNGAFSGGNEPPPPPHNDSKPGPPPQLLALNLIRLDANTQSRARKNDEAIQDYAERYKAGDKFPNVIVFHDGKEYFMADGFHRAYARIQIGAKDINADVRTGTRLDALKYSLGANLRNGLRRTNEDKHHCIQLALKEFPKLSDRAVADMCGVHNETVAAQRPRHVTESVTSKVTGKDGKQYPKNKPASKKANMPTPPVPPVPPVPKSPPVPSNSKPDSKPKRPCDKTALEIPDGILELWQASETKAKAIINLLRGARTGLNDAQDKKDVSFAEVNFSSALSSLDQAIADASTAVPFAVCPTCQGELPEKCTACKTKGFVSKFYWDNCATKDQKEMREKVVAEQKP